jgi:hypothetical protein
VETKEATGVGANKATLHGVSHEVATASFEYGEGDSVGGTPTVEKPVREDEEFTVTITGLRPNTTYHYRAKLFKDERTYYGYDKTFTTSGASPPSVTTNNATSVSINGATLNGNLGSKGDAASVSVNFEYGLNTGYGSTTSVQAMTSTGVFDRTVGGLSPNTTYHYRAKASGEGTVYGEDTTFTTASPPPPPSATLVTINFDELSVPSGGSFTPPKDTYKSRGVVIDLIEADGKDDNYFIVVRHLLYGNGAHSQPYSVGFGYKGSKQVIEFVDPATGAPAVTTFVSIWVGDKSGEADPVTMTAYDINGRVIGSVSFTSQPNNQLDDATDFGLIELRVAGIHRIELTDTDLSGADFDDLTFNSPTLPR